MSQATVAQFETAALSDTGVSRRENQDACAVIELASGARLVVVADGMGGHQGGATASREAIAAFRKIFAGKRSPNDQTLRAAFLAANQRIHELASKTIELQGMGTTGVALLLQPMGRCWVAHVGDSRAYRLREGELAALTEDHSVVQEMVKRGMISEEDAEHHPRSNEILRALGIHPEVEVEVAEIELASGDRYLLCSDGLSGVVSKSEIAEVMAGHEPDVAVRKLVDEANFNGGPDNVTALVVHVGEIAAPAAAPGVVERIGFAPLVAAVAAVAIAVALWLSGGDEPTDPDIGPSAPLRTSMPPLILDDGLQGPNAPVAPLSPAAPAPVGEATPPTAETSPTAESAMHEPAALDGSAPGAVQAQPVAAPGAALQPAAPNDAAHEPEAPTPPG